jgi:hypothetical protein
MDMGARRWLVKTAYRHLWRVHSFYDIDDLIQDGHMMYALVVQRYPQAKDPPHIMRLFQITFLNHIHDLSKHQSRMAALVDTTVDIHDENVMSYSSSIFRQHGKAAAMVDHGDAYFIPQAAPWYIHAFLRLLCDPWGQQQLRSQYRIRLSGVRELTHDRLCRMIGADPDTTPTMPDALETYFRSV